VLEDSCFTAVYQLNWSSCHSSP